MARAKEYPSAQGVYAALATPRKESSTEADVASFLDYLDAVARGGVDGLVLFGSTGEFIHFDVSERVRAASIVIRRSRVPVLINVSHSTLDGALLLAEHASSIGAAGVLLTPPYFYAYQEDEIFYFYKLFASAIDESLRVYLYNLPASGNVLSVHLVQRLLDAGLAVGIKDSTGDWSSFEALLGFRCNHSFRLLAGNERIYLAARTGGADGIVSGFAAALPELIVAIDRSISAGDSVRAQQLNQRLLEYLEWVDRFPATIAIKQTARARGWGQDHFAVPPDPVTAHQLTEFRAWLAGWLPAVLSECGHRN